MLRFRRIPAIIFGVLLGSSAFGLTQAKLENQLIVHDTAREFQARELLKNHNEKEGDATEIFATMDFAIRHLSVPNDLLLKTANRANSQKIGGLFDKETMKTFGAAFATDLVKHEAEEVQHEADQDAKLAEIENLKKQILELQIQLDQFRPVNKKSQ